MDIEDLLNIEKRPAGKYYFHDDIDLLDALVGIREYLINFEQEHGEKSLFYNLLCRHLKDILKLCRLKDESINEILNKYFDEILKNFKNY